VSGVKGIRLPRVACPQCGRAIAASSDPDGAGRRLRQHRPCGSGVWVVGAEVLAALPEDGTDGR
jgi:hypothetical protein